MNRFARIVLATTAIAGVGALVAATAQADGRSHGGGEGHGGYHHQDGGFAGPMGRGGHGMRGRGMMRMFENFDTNGDGALTQEEIDAFRAGRFAAFDGNGDKVLTLDEYQALWLDAVRERMVDRFQHLDADGDGKVTGDEFKRPFARMVAHADRNEDGKLDRADRPDHGMHHGDGEHGKMGRHHDDDDEAHERRGPGMHRDER